MTPNIQGQNWEKLWSPSKTRESGTKYGDDVCEILTNELDMPDVPNDVFPEGVQVRNLLLLKVVILSL